MPEISFRKEALERLTSPDQLDERVTLTPQKGWIALLGATVLVAFAFVWGVFAEIPVKIQAPGVFLLSGPVYQMSPAVDTKISEWKVDEGDHVVKGQLLATFDNPELEAKLKIEKESLEDLKSHYKAWRQIQTLADRRWKKTLEDSARDLKAALARISSNDAHLNMDRVRFELERTDYELKRIKSDSEKSSDKLDRQLAINEMERRIQLLETKIKAVTQLVADRDGIVIQILAYPPLRVEAGQKVIVLSPPGDPRKDLIAYAFVKPNEAPAVEPGQKVDIRVANFNAEQTGLLIGRVQSISPTSLSVNAIANTIPISGLAQQITSTVSLSPHLVIIELLREEASPTGYHWSGFDPSRPLTPGNRFTSFIILKKISPISYLLPTIHRFI